MIHNANLIYHRTGTYNVVLVCLCILGTNFSKCTKKEKVKENKNLKRKIKETIKITEVSLHGSLSNTISQHFGDQIRLRLIVGGLLSRPIVKHFCSSFQTLELKYELNDHNPVAD